MTLNQKRCVTRYHVCATVYCWIIVFALHQVSGQVYIGCFDDYQDDRILPHFPPEPSLAGNNRLFLDNSPENCTRLCLNGNFQYAGLQDTSECYCGNDDSRFQSSDIIDESQCNAICPGNSTAKCGGYFTMSIYSTGFTGQNKSQKGCDGSNGCTALSPTNGNVSKANPASGEEVTYSCDNGYTLSGQETVNCTSGSLSDLEPTCTPDGCTALSPTNGNVSKANPASGEEVTYSCDNGYTLSGQETVNCTSGSLSDLEPTCTPDGCTALSPTNGNVSKANPASGEEVTYSCDNGYTLSGQETVNCISGSLSDLEPTCTPDGCKALSPTNGHVSKTNPASDEEVTYSCDNGYTLSGQETVNCISGSLSDLEPTCKSDSALTYVEPTSDGNVGTRGSIAQGATGVVYTVDVTTADVYVITYQVPSGVLEFASALNGAVSVVSGQIIDSATSTSHVMTVTAGDSRGSTGTITITLTVYNIYYINPIVCYDLRVGKVAGPIHTSAASGALTIVYALSGTANTGYTFTPGSAVIENYALITSSTKQEKVVTVVTATEYDGAAGTATQTVFFCISGDCECGLNFSGATCPTFGLMIILSAFMLQALK